MEVLSILIFSWFSTSIPSVMCYFQLQFFSMPNSIPISWQYLPTACIEVFSSFSFLASILMSSMYIRWLIFNCDLVSLYLPVHFLSMWFSGIITIPNSNGDSAYSLKIPLWILTSVRLLPQAVSSTFQFLWFSRSILRLHRIPCTV